METKTYRLKGYKGINDLKSEYAFAGNSQGDSSVSNSIEDYKAAKGWMSFIFDCDLVQSAIDLEVEKRKAWNKNYIETLKMSGEYKKEYITTIELVHNPLLDDNEAIFTNGNPLTSVRLVFLNDNKDDG